VPHQLKSISKAGIPEAIAKAELYRYLNEPEEAESICRDILVVDADHQRKPNPSFSHCAIPTSAITTRALYSNAAPKPSSTPAALLTSYFRSSKKPCGASPKPKKYAPQVMTTASSAGTAASASSKAAPNFTPSSPGLRRSIAKTRLPSTSPSGAPARHAELRRPRILPSDYFFIPVFSLAA
jgi:hypothetical protein